MKMWTKEQFQAWKASRATKHFLAFLKGRRSELADRWADGDSDARRPPELLTRDVVARAITEEVKAGRGSPHGGVFLDIASRRSADFIKRKLPSMYHQFMELAEVDITAAPMEVGPTLHYFMGGVRVDADTQMTRVPGLFAAGECAAGMHGANRLGGNSLSDLVVFGRLAGLGVADYVAGIETRPAPGEADISAVFRAATDILNREQGPNPYLLHEQLQEIMGQHVGIVRNGEELTAGIEKLKSLERDVARVKAPGSSQFNPGWDSALSLRSLTTMAEAVARAALTREESRGAHTRIDFEGEREEGLEYNVVIRRGSDGTMEVEKVRRPEPPTELAGIAHAAIEDLEATRTRPESTQEGSHG
ncbi:MAG: FAD-binding protein [Candidatus Krumholzibacteriota bacterium]|nr:FAD-binding protein [Candidatus Krumholzibacteriota bacterium]